MPEYPLNSMVRGLAAQSLVTRSDPVQENAEISTTPYPYALFHRFDGGYFRCKTARSIDRLKKRINAHPERVNLVAAGINIGSQRHYVAVPEALDDEAIREFTCGRNDFFCAT